MAKNQEEIKKNILKTTKTVYKKQSEAYNNLKRQGQSLKALNNKINELRDERRKGDQDLAHIKRHQKVLNRFFREFPKFTPIVTTESEEPDPDPESVEKLWEQLLNQQHYKSKTWEEKMDVLLTKLIEQSDEYEAEVTKQIKLITKINVKVKIETKELAKSTQKMKDIRK